MIYWSTLPYNPILTTTGQEGWRRGVEKTEASVKAYPYLYYHQSLLYALCGEETLSQQAYTSLKHR